MTQKNEVISALKEQQQILVSRDKISALIAEIKQGEVRIWQAKHRQTAFDASLGKEFPQAPFTANGLNKKHF